MTIAAAATAVIVAVAVVNSPGPNGEEVEIAHREDRLRGHTIRLPAGTADRLFLDKRRRHLVGVL